MAHIEKADSPAFQHRSNQINNEILNGLIRFFLTKILSLVA